MNKRTNYRVVVHPFRSSRYVTVDEAKACDWIRQSVERHVDDVDYTEIEFDTVCEFCGNPWEQPPICCEAAIQEWERKHPEWTCDADGNWREEAQE